MYNSVLEELIDYSNNIIDGKIIACKKHIKVCKRFISDLHRMEHDESFFYYWDEYEAQKIVSWFKYMKHSKGVLANKPILLDSFQKFIVCNIEAWKHIETGYRRFKYAYIQLARKNAKSQMEAGMGSYEAGARGISAAEIYTLGVERDQAKIVFDEVDLMSGKYVSKRFKFTQKEITHKRSRSFIKHLSKKAGKTGDGKNPQMAIIDEYHAHPDATMYNVMVSGMGARKESLIVIITTAGFDFEDKPCYAEYTYCSNILDETLDNDEYFIMITELDKGDDPKDSNLWPKANPIICSYKEGRDFLQRECKRAYDSNDEEKIRNFLTKNCNIWIKYGTNKFLNIDYWYACKKEITFEDFKGMDCYIGIDLSKTGDLTSISFEFPFLDSEIRKYAFFSQSFLPAAVKNEKMLTDKVPYDFWIKKGWLIATEANQGQIVDYWAVINCIEDKVKTYNLKVMEICYDAHNANLLVAELERIGYECVQIPQSAAKLDEPTRNFQDLVKVNQIVHDGNKLLSWAINNSELDTNSFGEIKISKKSTFKRIDPAATCIFSHKRAMTYWSGDLKDVSEFAEDDFLDKLWS
ncbi:terminase large subunit [Helicovermis profundi]|uniref:Terminase large subunit n=1 Tax=Helicovermis profundi TaxID=3065157 RepID=A0AAU9END0_9FIRM|nr:terminase large subunit [Clostridia bacterium S502]